MTDSERERDERDLAILREYEMGEHKTKLMRRYGVSKYYLYKLIEESAE